MVTMVVGAEEFIDAVTREAAKPKIKRRWLQVFCILLRCLDVVESCCVCWSEVGEGKRKSDLATFMLHGKCNIWKNRISAWNKSHLFNFNVISLAPNCGRLA